MGGPTVCPVYPVYRLGLDLPEFVPLAAARTFGYSPDRPQLAHYIYDKEASLALHNVGLVHPPEIEQIDCLKGK